MDNARYTLPRNWWNSGSVGAGFTRECGGACWCGIAGSSGPFWQVAGAELEAMQVRETLQWQTPAVGRRGGELRRSNDSAEAMEGAMVL